VVTFVITLVATSLIIVIITRMYFKRQIKKIASTKNTNTQDNSQFVLMNRLGIKMDSTPAYGMTDMDSITKETDSAYAMMDRDVITKETDPAYAGDAITKATDPANDMIDKDTITIETDPACLVAK